MQLCPWKDFLLIVSVLAQHCSCSGSILSLLETIGINYHFSLFNMNRAKRMQLKEGEIVKKPIQINSETLQSTCTIFFVFIVFSPTPVLQLHWKHISCFFRQIQRLKHWFLFGFSQVWQTLYSSHSTVSAHITQKLSSLNWCRVQLLHIRYRNGLVQQIMPPQSESPIIIPLQWLYCNRLHRHRFYFSWSQAKHLKHHDALRRLEVRWGLVLMNILLLLL